MHVPYGSGSCNSWHNPPGGQILPSTGGTGHYQKRRRVVQIISKGVAAGIAADVEPDAEFAGQRNDAPADTQQSLIRGSGLNLMLNAQMFQK